MSQVFSAHGMCYIFSTGGNKIDFMISGILPKKENKEKTTKFLKKITEPLRPGKKVG